MTLADDSASLAMLSLQGPAAGDVLSRVVDARGLPENKRNRISAVDFEGRSLAVARTGYTGESICFELFPESDAAVRLWERLVEAGATPVGLGARDSLRLEAGLPLYGHELGPGPDGRDIPLFANSLGAVRGQGRRGRRSRRRAGAESAARGVRDDPAARARHSSARTDPDAPGAAGGGLRRPAAVAPGLQGRAPGRGRGMDHLGDHRALRGVRRRGGSRQCPAASMRCAPSGSRCCARTSCRAATRRFTSRVLDPRGNTMTAQVVERNAWPVPPFVRPFGGFEAPAEGARASTSKAGALAARLAGQGPKATTAGGAPSASTSSLPSTACRSSWSGCASWTRPDATTSTAGSGPSA